MKKVFRVCVSENVVAYTKSSSMEVEATSEKEAFELISKIISSGNEGELEDYGYEPGYIEEIVETTSYDVDSNNHSRTISGKFGE